MIKSCDAHVRFCLLTGVSKFSKISLFSGLNNLIDITLEPALLVALRVYGARSRNGLRTGAGGARPGDGSATGTTATAGAQRRRSTTPSTHCCCSAGREFRAWWFETGTPTFLIETLVSRGVPVASLDGMVVGESRLGTFDVGAIATEALLFQTGYLTLGGPGAPARKNGSTGWSTRTARCARA